MAGDLKKVFGNVAEANTWGGAQSKSGPGSDLIQTQIIRKEIPTIIKNYNVLKVLDVPCGDFFWMKEIKQELSELLHYYIGGDIVPQLISKNNELYADEKFSFIEIDITSDYLPNVDLIVTRDCFLHLSYRNIYKALFNYKKSKAIYLLVSSYTAPRKNCDVLDFNVNGRAINLQKYPFFFPDPLEIVNEGCTEGNGEYADKSLALWRIKDLNLHVLRIHLFLKHFISIVKKAIG